MKTDYKFAYIKRHNNIHISECGVRFYEGDVTTEDETDPITNEVVAVTRYRRAKKLNKKDLKHIETKKFKPDISNGEIIIYTNADFGKISSDDELRVFLNGELRKDKGRTPIDEQNTLDITKVK